MPKPSSLSAANGATFDAWNRLMSVSSSGSLIQQNAFDGENRRVTKLVDATLRHYYFSLDWQSLEERVGPSMSADRQFVFGPMYRDNLILRDQIALRLYSMQDATHDVCSLADAFGNVVERVVYQPYGLPQFMTSAFLDRQSSQYNWETTFAGSRYDSDSGLLHFRRRDLHPYAGCWLTRDPLHAERSLSIGDYVYARDNPTGWLDEFGLACVPLDPATLPDLPRQSHLIFGSISRELKESSEA